MIDNKISFMESGSPDNSSLKKDYTPKGKKQLSSFKKINCKNTSVISKYYKKDKKLKNIEKWIKKGFNISGYLYLDGDELVGYIVVCDNNIDPIFIYPKYRGYGLSSQIMDVAIHELKATTLWVYKDNEIAVKLYKSKGFRIVKEETNGDGDICYFMQLGSAKSIEESAIDTFLNKYGTEDFTEFSNDKLELFQEISNLNIELNNMEYIIDNDNKIITHNKDNQYNESVNSNENNKCFYEEFREEHYSHYPKKINSNQKKLSSIENDEPQQKASIDNSLSIYSLKGRKQVKFIIDLNKTLNKFKYGYIDDDGNLVDDENFGRLYRYKSIQNFEKTKTGVCWDYANYQEYKLKRQMIECKNYYIELETPMSDTHTFTIAKVDDWYIYLESSFQLIRGVYRSRDIENLILYVLKGMLNSHKGKSIKFHIYSYSNYHKYDVDCLTFMNDMKKFKKIKTGITRFDEKFHPDITLIYGDMNEIYMESSDNKKRKNDKGESVPDICPKCGSPVKLFIQGEPVWLCSNKECKKYFGVAGFNKSKNYNEDVDIIEPFFEGAIAAKPYLKDLIYERVEKTLSQPENDRKLRRIISEFIDRNITKLTTSGPVYLIVFGDADQKLYFDLFGITPKEIQEVIIKITKETGSNSDFKLLRGNPIFALLYYIIRYYSLKKDTKGLNSILSIYAISVYWSIFTKFFPKGVNEPIMQFTIDNLTDKFLIKKCNHIFGALCESIQRSYQFHKNRIAKGNDDDCVAWIQRIRNDQNSMIKKIRNEYEKNYKEGNAVSTRNDDYDPDNPILDNIENATTAVQAELDKVCLPIISNGIDIVYAEAAAKMAGISVSDTRLYLVKIMVQKNLVTLEKLIESILFLFIYEDKRRVSDIKSRYFLAWAASLFKKTNSKDKNIGRINEILEKWAEESGIYERFTREASRINYKKAIFFYIILNIQKYS